MSELSLAYIFHHQQLLVDQNLQLPKVEKLASDLLFTHDEQVIARDLLSEEAIPEVLCNSFQFVNLFPTGQKNNFYRQVVLYSCSNGDVITSFVATVGMLPKYTLQNMLWCALLVATTNIRVNPCIITIITKGDDEILLAKSIHNKTNMYGLIAGFVEVGETLEEAVQREALEEVGLKLKNIQYMSSQPLLFQAIS